MVSFSDFQQILHFVSVSVSPQSPSSTALSDPAAVEESEDGGLSIGVIAAIAAAILLLLLIALLIARRRKREREQHKPSADASGSMYSVHSAASEMSAVSAGPYGYQDYPAPYY